MALVEKLGTFYLGKEYDLKARKLLDQAIYYDSRDLTTHGVCVGMTGSGKTGLCIGLLEEAAIDKVPAILIDPKGDITNLLLTFPELRPEDFRPWVNLDDAQRKGMSLEEYAVKTAQTWRDGLASWDQGPERIRLLKDSADFAIYTPGSEAGLPVNILASFKAPSLDWETEAEMLRDRIQGTVSALLGLVGVDADPIRSREHILLSNIFEHTWRAGEDLDIARLILSVQKPPFSQLGVFALDTFFPAKDRFGLAMALNNIIASPSFAAWLKGDPLDVASLLYAQGGKPRHSIFYIAHLNDAERMFFVTILLQQIISWMRAQPGTTSLRAIIYMDEVFGFFPPISEPPSKRPMLTLLKQARAFGVGVLLATQNPVDLDYKGLSNTGTWFIGKLQTERDKARLMEGLQSVAGGGTLGDAKEIDKALSSLESRVFLLHNVHAGGPVVMSTRWAMSYLRGPLTRDQVKTLMAPRKIGVAPTSTAAKGTKSASAGGAEGLASLPGGLASQPTSLPPGIQQAFLPVTVTRGEARAQAVRKSESSVASSDVRLVYEPALLGIASVRFFDAAREVDEGRDYALALPIAEEEKLPAWRDAFSVAVEPRRLAARPEPDAMFVPGLPETVTDGRAFKAQTNELRDFLYANETYTILRNSSLKLFARAGESERDFKARCAQAAREARDAAVDKMRDKYAAKIDQIEKRKSREEQEMAQDKAEYSGRAGEELLGGLSTVVGALGLFGRSRRSTSSFSAVARRRRMTSAAKADIAESETAIKQLEEDIQALNAEIEAEAGDLTQQWAGVAEDVQAVQISPRRTDVDVQMVTLAWAPHWEIRYEDAGGRSRTERVPAYPTVPGLDA